MKDFDYDVRANFARQEDYCEYLFNSLGPFWHVCTPGNLQECIFVNDSDYRVGVNSAALTKGPVVIYASTVMSNHLHDIVGGERDKVLDAFERRKRLIQRYVKGTGRSVDLKHFNSSLIPIESLKVLRTEIVYVHRNGYLAHPSYTPFSYPWSSGRHYFNPGLDADGVPFASLPYKSKRMLCRGRILPLPDDWIIKDGIISFKSFVDIQCGERFFRDSHQYFSLLSKNYEAYSETAKRLGELIFLTDDELFSAVCSLCLKTYGQSRPSALAPDEKLSVAVEMKKRYNASNGQIRRILRLDAQVVKELFP